MPATATLYASELERLSRFACAFPRRETGGEFWGYLSRNGSPVVVLVTGPGPAARHGPTWFFQDIPALEARARWLSQHHGLYQVGNWHSHHSLGLRRPSAGDDHTVHKWLPGMGWSTFLMGLANLEGPRHASVGLNTYTAQGERHETAVKVLSGESPHAHLLGDLPCAGEGGGAAVPVWWEVRAPQVPWFELPGVSARLAQEVEALGLLAKGWGTRSQVELRGGKVCVRLPAPGGEWAVKFGEGFPRKSPAISFNGSSAWLEPQDGQFAAEVILWLSARNAPPRLLPVKGDDA